MTRTLGRLERRAAAVPVPGTADDRVQAKCGQGRRPAGAKADGSARHNRRPPRWRLRPGRCSAIYRRVFASPATSAPSPALGSWVALLYNWNVAGIATSTYLDSTAVSRQAYPFDPSGPDLNVNLVCVNADEFPNFANRADGGSLRATIR